MRALQFSALAAALLLPVIVLGEPKPADCDKLKYSETALPADLLLCRFGGIRCVRTERAGGAPAPGAVGDPARSLFEATEESVYVTCGGLGCVDAPDSDDPHIGVCGKPQGPGDCGGTAARNGLCADRHEILQDIDGIVPTRFFFTASPIVDSGFKGAAGFNPDVAAGVLFQVGLGKSESRRLANGGLLHYAFPNYYLHTELLWSKFRAGYDVGAGYKTGCETLSRVALTVFGQYSGEGSLSDDSATYRMGPAGYVEIFYNLIVKGGWLPFGTGDGPVWFFGLTYGARFFDDFLE